MNDLHSFPLDIPSPLELCVEGNFEKLFELYYDEPMFSMLNFHGYQPEDYIMGTGLKQRDDFMTNIRQKLEVAKNRHGYFKGYQPIHYAVAHGDLQAVRKLVEKYKCSPCQKSIHIACYLGHFEVVQYLIKECECFNSKDKQQVPFESLCHEVHSTRQSIRELQFSSISVIERHEFYDKKLVGTGHFQILMFLCECYEFKLADTAAELIFQYTLLRGDPMHLEFLEANNILKAENVLAGTSSTHFIQFSLFGNNLEMLELLLRRNVIVSDAELLATAVECCVSDEVISLLVIKCSFSPLYTILQHKKMSLIIYIGYHAIHNSNKTTISKFLLDKLIEKYGDSSDTSGQNILHYITANRNVCSLADFVSLKKPHLQRRRDSNGQLPLHIACSKIAESRLLDFACSQIAERYPEDDILNLVKTVSSDCDINAQDKHGNTPLHIACSQENWIIVQYLVWMKNASVTLRNTDGIIPFQYLRRRLPSIIPIDSLLLVSCDLNARYRDGNTLLHHACIIQCVDDIQYLVHNLRADIHMTNLEGKNGLHIVSSWYMERKPDEVDAIFNCLANDETESTLDGDGNTPLHIACSQLSFGPLEKYHIPLAVKIYNKAGDLPIHCFLGTSPWRCFDAAKLLLQEIDVNLRDANGNTPLHLLLACQIHFEDIMLYLIEFRGAMTQIRNKRGQLPLHLIIKRCCKNWPLVSFLINSESLFVQDEDGNTPLHLACTIYPASITFLLASEQVCPVASLWSDKLCTDFVASTLRLEALDCILLIKNNSNSTPLQLMLDNVEDPCSILGVLKNFSFDNLDSTICDEFLLHIYFEKGVQSEDCTYYCDVIRILINSRNAQLKNVSDEGILHSVFKWPGRHFKDFISLIQELLNARNEDGKTPLHVLCKYSDMEAFKFVLQCKGSKELVQLRDNSGRTVLHCACNAWWRHEETIKIMILECDDSKEFLDTQDENGSTALHIALKNGFLSAAKLLLEFGCTPNIKDNNGNIPLHFARHIDVAKLLPTTGQDVLTLNSDKLSPIHLAVEKYCIDLSRYLYEYCDYNDIVHMVAVEGAKLPIQVFFQKLLIQRSEFMCQRIKIAEMAGYLLEHGFDYEYLEFEEIAILMQFMCKTSFIETEIYLREPLKHSVSTGKCSLKSPPYSHIDRVELMHAAAWFGRVDIIQYLIEKENVDPCSTDVKGRNSLWFACGCTNLFSSNVYLWCTSGLFCQGNPEMEAIQLLLETGCSIFTQDSTTSPFEWVCNTQNLKMLKALTSAPESANLQDEDGNTPLMVVIALWNSNEVNATRAFIRKSSEFLIPRSNQSMTNNKGYSALYLACKHELPLDIVRKLDLSHSLSSSSLNSPLEIAIKHGNMKALKYLIFKLNISSEALVHLIDLCLQEKQKCMAKYLLRNVNLNQILKHDKIFPLKAMKFCILHCCKFSSDLNLSGNMLLHIACQYNIPQIVRKRMNSGNVSISNNAGDTPLHIACTYNRFVIVEILKTGGANLKATNHKGNIPLHVASQFSAYKCIKALDTAEYDVKNEYSGDTALHIACSNESYACVTALSSGSLCVQNCSGDTPLHIACQHGYFSIVYFLLKNVPDFHQALSTTNRQGELPLQLALVSFGKQMHTRVRLHAFFDLIKLTPNLIEHHQLMHLACQCKIPQNYKIAQFFKSMMVPINVPDACGRLPIHYASSNTLDLVMVCSSKELVDFQDIDGNTALHIACSSGKTNICKYLVQDMKCNISITNKRGEVALHTACNVPPINYKICKLLLKEVSFVPDFSENYPVHYLCKNYTNEALKLLSEMMETLTEKGMANTVASYPNSYNLLPIHYLCKSKATDALKAVKIIVNYTGDLNARSLSCDSPLHLACLSRRCDIIELLAKPMQQQEENQPMACDVTIPADFNNLPLHLVCNMRLLIDSAVSSATHEQDPLARSLISFDSVFSYLSVQGCINAVNDDSDTPLHLLLKNNSCDDDSIYMQYEPDILYCGILKSLLSHGASPSKRNASGEFPIHLACRYQILAAVKLLECCGMNDKAKNGGNIFHYAFENPQLNIEFFEYLLKVGKVSLLCEQNCDGNIPLHIYCILHSNIEVFQKISCLCDINYQNNDGNTAFHILIKNSEYYRKELFMEFVKNGFDLTLQNKKGNSVLDYISAEDAPHGMRNFAKEIFSFYSNPEKLDALKNILACAGKEFIIMLFLSEAGVVRKLADLSIDPTPLYKAYKEFFDDEQKPLQVPMKLLFIGDAMTGKTTLIKSLRKDAGLEIEEGEPERTAGIAISTFQSTKYGKVTTYDFAGQKEYYAGHESVMQSIVQKTPPLVLIHVKLTTPREKIMKQIVHWSKFIQNPVNGKDYQIIIVCSHADKTSKEDTELISQYIGKKGMKLAVAPIVCMDCRDSKSSEMNQLVRILESKAAALRHKGVTSFKAHCLYVLITQLSKHKPYLTMNELYHLQRTRFIKTEYSRELLSSDFQELKRLCKELSQDGQIMLLDDRIPQKSWIVLDSNDLFGTISGKLFAPEDFAIHEIISSNTGVVLFSKMKALFPEYDTNMLFKFLGMIEYCFEVRDAIVLNDLLKQPDCSLNEKYYFFPGLISAERKQNIISWDPPKSGSSCWVLKCEDQGFFSPKFIQLLLLRLVFSCTKTRSVSKSAAHIWTSGLFWCNGDGVETMVAVIDTSKVIVFMQQRKPGYNVKLLKHRSTCINLVRELQHEICPSIDCKEYFTHPSHMKESIETLAIENYDLVPMDEIFDEIRAGNEFIVYNGLFEVRNVVLFDPYAYLCENLVKTLLLNKDYNKVSNRLLKYLTDHYYKVQHEIFIELFGISVTALALDGSSNSEPVERFLQMLKQWGKKTERTIGELRQKFNSISIFATSSVQADSIDALVPSIKECPSHHDVNNNEDYEWYTSSLPANASLYLEQRLDWDNDGDRDLIEIAHHMIHWEENLSSPLGLTAVDIHDIKQGNNLRNHCLQRREALKMWKNNQGLTATYGNLLKLFVIAGHTGCAEVLCEVLKRRTNMLH